MLFNTWQFWAFLAVVLPVYWALPFRWQNRFLIVASYYFYACWNWKFLPLIAGSTLMDYLLGMAVARAPSGSARRRLVAISVVANLAILGFFKYCDFFIASFHDLGAALGLIGAGPSPILGHRAARRDQLLHVPGDELHDRHLPRVSEPTDASATSRCSCASFRTSSRGRSCEPATLLPQGPPGAHGALHAGRRSKKAWCSS